MENRVNKGVSLHNLIASGFSGTFNARQYKLLSKKDKEKLKKLIDVWELNNIINKEFRALSDGQKRRGLLARALVFEPKLLVLDEPFCNLDIKSNFILSRNLNTLIDNSVNILYVTHSLESILDRTNRVIIIKNGKIMDSGKPDNLINSKILSDLFNISIKVIKQDNYWRSIQVNN